MGRAGDPDDSDEGLTELIRDAGASEAALVPDAELDALSRRILGEMRALGILGKSNGVDLESE